MPRRDLVLLMALLAGPATAFVGVRRALPASFGRLAASAGRAGRARRVQTLRASAAPSTYVTTPIFYVNDVPHVGHAYTSIAADACARFARLDGQPTRFATGTDEHGEKVQQSAEKKGIAPQEFCDGVSAQFQAMGEPFHLSNDAFVRTTDASHKEAVKEIWKRLEQKDLIYKGTYEGWYSVRDECFYTESELVENDKGEKVAPSGSAVEWRAKEPSYFFRLSSFTQPLLDYYEQHPDFIAPESRKNEVVSFVKDGLKDLSVSRTSFSWGIPVPEDPEHVIYVWIDALTNYLTTVDWPASEGDAGGLYETFWPGSTHIVGKDILRFHAVYWPAMLMGAGLPLPKRIFAHGWWTKDGEKISKSLGNVIDPFELVETYGVDATRYFLLSATSFGSDADFSRREMLACCNGYLANAVGNLLNRAVTLSFKNCGKMAPPRPDEEALTAADRDLLAQAAALPEQLRAAFGEQAMHKAAQAVEAVIRNGNAYVDEQAPWAVRKTDAERFNVIMWTLLEMLRRVAVAYYPLMPDASVRMLRQVGVSEDALTLDGALSLRAIEDAEAFMVSTPEPWALPKPEAVFPRLDEEALEAAEAAKAEAQREARGPVDPAAVDALKERIGAAGAAVRAAKEGGADKGALQPLIDELLSLKADFQELTGEPFDPPKKKKKAGSAK